MFYLHIALILAVFRFLKYDDRKETIANNLERFSYVINKCRKTKHHISNFVITEENMKNYDELVINYENETYDYLITTRENFDNIMTYKELIYYRQKLRNLFIQEKFIKNDIESLELNNQNHRDFVNKNGNCCISGERINYHEYLNSQQTVEHESDA